jgi:ArsR family metal-binding transcriptional regulator
MKKEIKFRENTVVMKCVAMSHSSVGGEYELKLAKKEEFNLDSIWQNIKDAGYELEEKRDRSMSLKKGDIVITILKKGNMLIQDLLPDTHEAAMQIGEELINAEQLGAN